MPRHSEEVMMRAHMLERVENALDDSLNKIHEYLAEERSDLKEARIQVRRFILASLYFLELTADEDGSELSGFLEEKTHYFDKNWRDVKEFVEANALFV